MKILYTSLSRNNPYIQLLAAEAGKLGAEIYWFDTLPKGLAKYKILWQMTAIHVHYTTLIFSDTNGKQRGTAASLAIATASLLTLISFRLKGTKIVWTVHDGGNHEGHHSRIDRIFSRLLGRIADVLIVHSSKAKDIVASRYQIREQNKIKVVKHGNYIGYYPDLVDRESARKSLNIDPNAFIFLFFGNIRSYKGLIELIDAFKKDPAPDSVLYIVGKPITPDFQAEIERAIGDSGRIRLIPSYVPDAEVQTYMNAADVVTLPFVDILMSGSLILALSFGKPYIIPNIPSLMEYCDPQGGFIYEPRNLGETLAEAVRRRAELPAMGRYNKEQAKRLLWTDSARQTVDLYK